MFILSPEPIPSDPFTDGTSYIPFGPIRGSIFYAFTIIFNFDSVYSGHCFILQNKKGSTEESVDPCVFTCLINLNVFRSQPE